MVGLGLAKVGQDPQGPRRLFWKRDKNTNVCVILGNIVWKRPKFLKASLLKNHSQGGQLISQRLIAPRKCNCRNSPIWLYPASNKILSYFSETTEQTTSHAAKACTEEKILISVNTQSQVSPATPKEWRLDQNLNTRSIS